MTKSVMIIGSLLMVGLLSGCGMFMPKPKDLAKFAASCTYIGTVQGTQTVEIEIQCPGYPAFKVPLKK